MTAPLSSPSSFAEAPPRARGEVRFVDAEERARWKGSLGSAGLLAVEVPSPPWFDTSATGLTQRGKLREAIEGAIEEALEAMGAPSPGVGDATDLDQCLSDQLFRARSAGMSGFALHLPCLAAAGNLAGALDAEDSAVLRWWIAASAERPVTLLLDAANRRIGAYGPPLRLERIVEATHALAESVAPPALSPAVSAPLEGGAAPLPRNAIPLRAGADDAEPANDPSPLAPPVTSDFVQKEPEAISFIPARDAPPFGHRVVPLGRAARSGLGKMFGETPRAAPAPDSAVPGATPESAAARGAGPGGAMSTRLSATPASATPGGGATSNAATGATPAGATPAGAARETATPSLASTGNGARAHGTVADGAAPQGAAPNGGAAAAPPIDWRSLANELSVARGPKPLTLVERLFTTRYVPLMEALERGEADESAQRSVEQWSESFARSYTEGFAAFKVTGKRPRMVLDAPQIGSQIARLHGAKATQLVLVDALRFDLGVRVHDRMCEALTSQATCTERLLLWSALPTTTPAQLELLTLGPEGLASRGPQSEREEPVLRGRTAATLRRIKVGNRDVMKLDAVESRLREAGPPLLERLDTIADEVAHALAAHARSLPPRTLMFVFGDHGFRMDSSDTGTLPAVSGGATPEEVLVPAFAWLVGDVH